MQELTIRGILMNRKVQKIAMLLLLAALFVLTNCGSGGGGGGGFLPPSGPTAKPGTFNLVSPGDNDTASLKPTLSWTASSEAENYTVQVDVISNPSFTAPLLVDQTVTGTHLNLSSALTNSNQYIWRVIAHNSKGSTLATAGTNSYYTFTARNGAGGVEWAVVSDPTGTGAEAFAIAVDSGPTPTFMYVVGYDSNNAGQSDQWRIEKRRLSDGALITDFGNQGVINSNPTATCYAYAITADTLSLYIVGSDSGGTAGNARWRIEKRNIADGAPNISFSGGSIVATTAGPSEAFAVAKQSNFLFVAGYDTDAIGNEEWRIEKTNISTGVTDTIVTSATGTSFPGNTAYNEAFAIAVDDSSMFIAGYDSLSNTERWRIEKRDLSGNLVTGFSTTGIIGYPYISTQGAITAIATGPTSTSALYIVGYEGTGINFKWRIEKRDKASGDFDTMFGSSQTHPGYVISHPSLTMDDEPNAIVIDEVNNAMYVAGYESVSSTDIAWRIEKRFLDSGDLDLNFGVNGVITSNLTVGDFDDIWGIAADSSSGLYVAGYDSVPGIPEWRIEKRSK